MNRPFEYKRNSRRMAAAIRLISLMLAILLVFPAGISFAAASISVAAKATIFHDTEEEAVSELRESMKQRKTRVTVGIKGSIDEDGLQEVIGRLISEATAHTGKPDEGDYIAFQYSSYKGIAFTTYSGSIPAYEIEYDLTYYDDAEQEAEVDKKVNEILAGLDLDDKTHLEKVTAIHDYLCSNTEYEVAEEDSNIRRTAYGALIEGKAVCQGYCVSIYRLLLEAGIDNRIIFGTGTSAFTEGGPHSWNIVKIDGEYYYMDVTWDDSTKSRKYFLVPEGEGFEDEHIADGNYGETFFDEDYPMSDEEIEIPVKWVPDRIKEFAERFVEALRNIFDGKNGE